MWFLKQLFECLNLFALVIGWIVVIATGLELGYKAILWLL